jgi:hypothetical protein
MHASVDAAKRYPAKNVSSPGISQEIPVKIHRDAIAVAGIA